MNEIIENAYAEATDRTPVDFIYLIMGFIGFVFDYSVEHAGRSINKKLLVGTDLTIQINGTLIRFRQGKVTIVADIEKMFFQQIT